MRTSLRYDKIGVWVALPARFQFLRLLTRGIINAFVDIFYLFVSMSMLCWFVMLVSSSRKEGRKVVRGLCATVLAPSSIADWMKLSGDVGMEPFAHQSMLPASNTSSLFHRPFNFRG